jgi:hypothetical protein
MSKMYLWVLTLATKSEPTLIGELALSLQTISILDVASSSIALWCALEESGDQLFKLISFS